MLRRAERPHTHPAPASTLAGDIPQSAGAGHPASRRDARLAPGEAEAAYMMALLMISFMISLVPPPMASNLASRQARATGPSST